MSIELTNFTKRYEEAINSIKAMKQCNQRLQDRTSIDYKQQERTVESAKRKVQQWIADMERQYLDPQTARRVDIVKQQLTIECNKNKILLDEVTKPKSSKKDSAKEQIFQSEDEETQNSQLLFDHDTESRLNAQRSKQISQAHAKMLNIHSITEQTKDLTYQQGQQIDIIDENISTTLDNTKHSNSYLEEANKEQKKGQKKYIWLGAIVGITLVVVLLVIFLA